MKRERGMKRTGERDWKKMIKRERERERQGWKETEKERECVSVRVERYTRVEE